MQPPGDVVEAAAPAVHHFGAGVAGALLGAGQGGGGEEQGEEGAQQDRWGERGAYRRVTECGQEIMSYTTVIVSPSHLMLINLPKNVRKVELMLYHLKTLN